MSADRPALKIKMQVFCGDEIAMGPGKADLLDAIAGHHSISAAARALGMSYRRAWMLVDAMNRCWDRPLVETAAGRGARRGAQVTLFGQQVLQHYRALQEQADDLQQSGDWRSLDACLLPVPKARQER